MTDAESKWIQPRPIFTKREVVWIVAIVWLAQIITAALTLFALDHYFGPL